MRQVGQRVRAEGYARLAEWWHRGIEAGDKEEVIRKFRTLTDREHAERTPLEGISRRLPAKMAEALWEALRQLVDASQADCDRTEGVDRPPLLGAADASLVGPIDPLFDNQPGGTRPDSGP
jgi:hypothetical protein